MGKITELRNWWDRLTTAGPSYGYFPKASKTWLITKKDCTAEANTLFRGTGVNVTTDGRPYLGVAIGSSEYVTTHTERKIEEWVSHVISLAIIATTQPHAAFSALTHGLMSKWTYLSHTTPDVGLLLKPIDNALRSDLLPALTGRPPPSDLQCTLFALPARLGGLGIDFPSRTATHKTASSLLVTSTLCDHILSQDPNYGPTIILKQLESKKEVHQQNIAKSLAEANRISEALPDPLRRAMDFAKEKGASTWLTALLQVEHGFALHKGAFQDTLALRYGWTPADMSLKCVCGTNSSVEHAMSCARGGFPSLRHNEIRDLTATLLTEVCNNVCTEPELQPLSQEALRGASANCQDGKRLDIAANGFWGGTFERTYFDVRVFNPLARRTDTPNSPPHIENKKGSKSGPMNKE